MGCLRSVLVFSITFGSAVSAQGAQQEAEVSTATGPRSGDAVLKRSEAEMSGTNPERSGVSFGASWGLGAISNQGVVGALGGRLGYALSPRVVLLADMVAFFWNGSDPPGPTVSRVEWQDLACFSLAAQIVLLPRVWLRPGVALAKWHGSRSTATATGHDVTDVDGSAPAIHLAVGADVAAGKHNVFDVALSSFAFKRDYEFTYTGALLFGYSFY